MDITKRELNYTEIKDKIKSGLTRVSEGFVEIGYYLRKVRDEELYKEDGYESINDFAQDMYGLSQSSTSRFIAINEAYSVGGNSPKLLPEFAGYGSSKLSEMLTLSEEEIKLVSIRSTVAEIRTIKEAKKESEELDDYATSHNDESLETTQSCSDLNITETRLEKKLIIDFFRDKNRRNTLKELAKLIREDIEENITEKIAEIVNPSGHLMFRKGINVIIFEEDIIKYSKLSKGVQEITYTELLKDTAIVFEMAAEDPWVIFYGETEPEPEPVPKQKSDSKPEPKPKVEPTPMPEPISEPTPGPIKEDKEKEETEEVEIVEADVVESTQTTDECPYCKFNDPLPQMTNRLYFTIRDGYLEVETKEEGTIEELKIDNCFKCGRKL